jgi:hypothetical protein
MDRRKIWTALAERSADSAFTWQFRSVGHSQSGDAHRYPPQSKIIVSRPGRHRRQLFNFLKKFMVPADSPFAVS